MSIISSTANQILNCPLNDSKTKMHYSFPKDGRFKENHKSKQ